MIQQTSLLAYRDVIDSLPDSQARVFNALRSMVEATDREICDFLGESDPNKVRPRRKELCDLGLIGEAQKRECSISHKTAIVWKVL
jgi:hypothetical protein